MWDLLLAAGYYYHFMSFSEHFGNQFLNKGPQNDLKKSNFHPDALSLWCIKNLIYKVAVNVNPIWNISCWSNIFLAM